MALPSLDSARGVLQKAAREHPLRLGLVFGSAAAGAAGERSDLDVALLADRPLDADRIQDELAEALAFDRIDVVDLFTAPPLLAFHALRDGVVLFEDRPGRHVACLCLAARLSADSAWMDRYTEAYLDRVSRRLRE